MNKAAFFLLLAVSALVSSQLVYLMNVSDGLVGHDYKYFIPRLFEGVLFYRSQGLSIPYYSVSFCGGLPFYGDPQTMFYSLPQFLSFYLSPWYAVCISVSILVFLSVFGTFFLVKEVFRLSDFPSLLASTAFAYNGFYRSRMAIGHFSYHSFMLIPLICYLLLSKRLSNFAASILLCILGAYFIHSGGHFVSFISIPSIAMVILLYLLLVDVGVGDIKRIVLRSAVAAVGSLALSFSKLVAVYSFMRFYPRRASFDSVDSWWSAGKLVFSQLFKLGGYTPFKWGIWEYDNQLSPLVLLGLVILVMRIILYRETRLSAWLLNWSEVS
ncbi:hypothetical protein BVY02_02070, partial [bacterium J17]